MSSTKKSLANGPASEPILNGVTTRLESIPLSQVHLPASAALPWEAGISVPSIVMLQPLVVVQTNDKTYILVDGYRRYAQHKKNGTPKIPATIIEALLSERELVTLRAGLNKHRPFGLREKLKLLEWAKDQYGKKAVETLSQLISVSRKEIVSVADLLGARDAVVEAVASERISLAALPAFLLLSPKDQDIFLSTFSECALSVQTQREFLEWLTEIAYRDTLSIEELLNEGPVQSVLCNEKLNWPQRIHKLRETLFQRRFPLLRNAQNEWNALARKIRPKHGKVTFVPSPYFEKNELEVHISVTSAEQIKRILGDLSNVPLEDWEKLVYPVQDEMP